MLHRHFHREREEDDPCDHREVQVRVGIAREGDAFGSVPLDEQLLRTDREEVEVREPERGGDDEAEQRRDDHLDAEIDAPSPETDRDQGLTDGDDHDQPVALDEMRRRQPPPAHAAEERPEKSDGEGGNPEHRLGRVVHEPGGEDERRAEEAPGNDAQDRDEEFGFGTGRERVQRKVHDRHDQKCHTEEDAVVTERLGHGERGDEHRGHGHQHGGQHCVSARIDGVRQPGIRRPRPPDRGEDQQPRPEPRPGRVLRDHGCRLCEREDEDEIEVELERRDPVLTLYGLLTHGSRGSQGAGVTQCSGHASLDQDANQLLLVLDRAVCVLDRVRGLRGEHGRLRERGRVRGRFPDEGLVGGRRPDGSSADRPDRDAGADDRPLGRLDGGRDRCGRTLVEGRACGARSRSPGRGSGCAPIAGAVHARGRSRRGRRGNPTSGMRPPS